MRPLLQCAIRVFCILKAGACGLLSFILQTRGAAWQVIPRGKRKVEQVLSLYIFLRQLQISFYLWYNQRD